MLEIKVGDGCREKRLEDTHGRQSLEAGRCLFKLLHLLFSGMLVIHQLFFRQQSQCLDLLSLSFLSNFVKSILIIDHSFLSTLLRRFHLSSRPDPPFPFPFLAFVLPLLCCFTLGPKEILPFYLLLQFCLCFLFFTSTLILPSSCPSILLASLFLFPFYF